MEIAANKRDYFILQLYCSSIGCQLLKVLTFYIFSITWMFTVFRNVLKVFNLQY
jgi:hypothetical protein